VYITFWPSGLLTILSSSCFLSRPPETSWLCGLMILWSWPSGLLAGCRIVVSGLLTLWPPLAFWPSGLPAFWPLGILAFWPSASRFWPPKPLSYPLAFSLSSSGLLTLLPSSLLAFLPPGLLLLFIWSPDPISYSVVPSKFLPVTLLPFDLYPWASVGQFLSSNLDQSQTEQPSHKFTLHTFLQLLGFSISLLGCCKENIKAWKIYPV